MSNARVFVEKKKGYEVEAKGLLNDLRNNLKLAVDEVRFINIYDVFNIDETDLNKAKTNVFSEPMVDTVLDNVNTEGYFALAYEAVPGQYDQRADSAEQCVRLLNPQSNVRIKSGRLALIKGTLSEADKKKITGHLINPIESRVKDLNKLVLDENAEVTPLAVFDDFNDLDVNGLNAFREKMGLAMSEADVIHVQNYFKNEEKRNPTETEIRVLDTYWSDHCRHTTFETVLESVTFNSFSLREDIERAYHTYQKMRHELGRDEKPETLMDMATIAGRYGRKNGTLQGLEVSDEINACSVYIDVDHDGTIEKWLLMFKNETHNHPTEIEPFGGASTCIGGAIRDPLSGRSYVYQAMRISGCGDVHTPIDETMENKLPQSVIATKATNGNSSYGNQIGLPTTFTKEIYHKDYAAKHLECGAVVGANKADNVKRLTSDPGNKIILLGGRTGRDGIGGATGSSKEHNEKSLEVCASEVQKGNAVEERKIQRLFRNEEVSAMIRKCNDFGAGGVCVAIGELADGLAIDLDKVRTKYAGLNATELAISESQERMAVVVAAEDVDRFIASANKENLEAYVVADVTDTNRLIITYHGEEVVNISRDFINTNGAKQYASAVICGSDMADPFERKEHATKENILNRLSDLNVASQKGMAETFDASIGSTTVLMPLSGKYQLTPSVASVQKLPVLDGKTTTCSILSYGYNPFIAEYSPYLGASYAVIESIAKFVAVGGDYRNAYASYQEYFERLGANKEAWGKVTQALLGTIEAQNAFHVYSIGGKDSMSGTFKDIHVPPTLLSFTCGTANVHNIISSHFKNVGNRIYLVKGEMKSNHAPDYTSYISCYDKVIDHIKAKEIISASVVEQGGIACELIKMALGNKLGFEVTTREDVLALQPGAIIVEANKEIKDDEFILLGIVSDTDYFRINDAVISIKEAEEAYLHTFDGIYRMYGDYEDTPVEPSNYVSEKKYQSKVQVDTPLVFIPVFPGTNCEYDIARAFKDEGAETDIFVFNNQSADTIRESIEIMAEKISKANIIAFPGGFSSGDEPDGSAKYIVNVLQNETVKNAIHAFLDNDGLILGICNGFQALIKSGLLPYGRIQTPTDDAPTLFRNNINRHISTMVTTRVGSNNSPWLADMKVGELHKIAVSHGEGKFVCNAEDMKALYENGQIAFQYCDLEGNVTMNSEYNVNASYAAIEGITSIDGRILGKMGHSERYAEGTFQNIDGNKKQNIFRNGVRYFTHK